MRSSREMPLPPSMTLEFASTRPTGPRRARADRMILPAIAAVLLHAALGALLLLAVAHRPGDAVNTTTEVALVAEPAAARAQAPPGAPDPVPPAPAPADPTPAAPPEPSAPPVATQDPPPGAPSPPVET